jgi:hypothetical protein
MLVDPACQEKLERIITCQEKFIMTPKDRRSLPEGLYSLSRMVWQKF